MTIASSFQEANREQNLLRLALEGMPGAGKTWTSLVFAQRLAEHYAAEWTQRGLRGGIAVIDAEHGRSKRYAGMKPTPASNALSFAVTVLTDFSPSNYTAKIEEAGRAGFCVLVVDSFSHEWAGRGGMLSLKDAQPAKKAYTGWGEINPLHDRVIDAILGSPCHVICTMRAKVKHIITEDNKPQKIGVGAVQRPGTEYEFEIYGTLDRSHILTISKSMCPAIDGAIIPQPRADFMDTVIQWLETGEAAKLEMTRRLLSEEQMTELIRLVNETGYGMDKLKTLILKRYKVQEVVDLTPDEADQQIARLRSLLPSPQPSSNGSHGVPSPSSSSASPPPAPMRQTSSFSAHAITEEQVKILAELRDVLFQQTMPNATAEEKKAKWKKILSTRKVETALALTQEQAAELISKMRTLRDVTNLQADANGSAEQARSAEGSQAAPAASGG